MKVKFLLNNSINHKVNSSIMNNASLESFPMNNDKMNVEV